MFDMVDYFVQGTTDEWVSLLEEELNEPKAVDNKKRLREIENINIVDVTKSARSKQQKTADSNDNTDIKRKTRYEDYEDYDLMIAFENHCDFNIKYDF
ncbi:3294_t:CDS:2 [Entrophospora sp. SA101]|nr:3294_t:CDS:2 [Entrophospora sp. SA101]